tara:strand:+ start:1148 stop:1288 length:141 start_codon:yes stop_codon:yes gene_type:complete
VIKKEEASDQETKEVVVLGPEVTMGKIQMDILSPMEEETLIEIMVL